LVDALRVRTRTPATRGVDWHARADSHERPVRVPTIRARGPHADSAIARTGPGTPRAIGAFAPAAAVLAGSLSRDRPGDHARFRERSAISLDAVRPRDARLADHADHSAISGERARARARGSLRGPHSETVTIPLARAAKARRGEARRGGAGRAGERGGGAAAAATAVAAAGGGRRGSGEIEREALEGNCDPRRRRCERTFLTGTAAIARPWL